MLCSINIEKGHFLVDINPSTMAFYYLFRMMQVKKWKYILGGIELLTGMASY
jgi:hypothetical protein